MGEGVDHNTDVRNAIHILSFKFFVRYLLILCTLRYQFCSSKFLLFNFLFRVSFPPSEKYISITMSDFMCFFANPRQTLILVLTCPQIDIFFPFSTCLSEELISTSFIFTWTQLYYFMSISLVFNSYSLFLQPLWLAPIIYARK